MKETENQGKARVVLACGVSGSGKTFFANRLVADHGFRRISADGLIWERYGDAFPTLPFDRQKEAFMTVNNEIDRLVAQAIGKGEKVVVDATHCKRMRRDALRQLCREHGVDPEVVFLDSSYEVLQPRMARRKGIGPDDQIVPDERLRMFCRGFEKPDAAEEAFLTPEEFFAREKR